MRLLIALIVFFGLPAVAEDCLPGRSVFGSDYSNILELKLFSPMVTYDLEKAKQLSPQIQQQILFVTESENLESAFNKVDMGLIFIGKRNADMLMFHRLISFYLKDSTMGAIFKDRSTTPAIQILEDAILICDPNYKQKPQLVNCETTINGSQLFIQAEAYTYDKLEAVRYSANGKIVSLGTLDRDHLYSTKAVQRFNLSKDVSLLLAGFPSDPTARAQIRVAGRRGARPLVYDMTCK